MKYKNLAAVLLSGLVLSACATREVYVSPVANFSKATDALNTSVTQQIPAMTSDYRASLARQDIYRRLIAPSGYAVSAPAAYLCNARTNMLLVSGNAAYIAAVSKALTAVAADPSTDFDALLKQLFTSYAITAKPFDPKKVKDPCADDLKNYPAAYYQPGDVEAGTIGDAVDAAATLWEVFKSIGVGVLGQVDSARRAKAMRDYLGDEKNIDSLNAALALEENALKATLEKKRRLAAADFVLAHDDFTVALGSLDTAKIGGCAAFQKNPVALIAHDGAFSRDEPVLRQCFHAAAATLDGKVDALVKAGAKYDDTVTADPAEAFENLQKALTRLHKIANGDLSEEDLSAIFASIATAYAVADKLKTDLSNADTKKKIDKAIDTLKGL